MSESSIDNLTPQEKRFRLAIMLADQPRRTPSVYPLSEGQRALWLLHRMAPTSAAYNISFALRIRSRVDVQGLQRALTAIGLRHPCLRSTFSLQNGMLVQEVSSSSEIQLVEQNLFPIQGADLNGWVKANSRAPFVLETGPLVRATLFHCGNEEHVILLTLHHVVCDGWSLWVLLDELKKSYVAEMGGTRPDFALPECSYADYVRWQADMLASQEGERLWRYWQSELNGSLPVLNLLEDRCEGLPAGASHGFSLTSDLTQRIRSLAKHLEVTTYTVLLATFQVLLHRLTGQEDLLVGTPAAGRTQRRFENVIGLFANPITLRTDFAGNPSFVDFVEQVRQKLNEALLHQDYPFSLLVKRLGVPRQVGRPPLVQALFAHQSPRRAAASSGWGSLLELIEIPQREGIFDICLETFESGRSLSGWFKYRSDRFSSAFVSRMAEYYQTLLQGVVRDPLQQVSDLRILANDDGKRIRNSATKIRGFDFDEVRVDELFAAQARSNPEALALLSDDESLTYHELHRRATLLAHYLRSLGVRPEVRVALYTDRNPSLIVGMMGILMAGGVYIPLDPSYPSARLDLLAQECSPTFWVVRQGLRDRIPSVSYKVIEVDADGHLTLNKSEAATPATAGAARSPRDAAYIIFTSGSTGRPKGVVVEHGSLSNLVRSQAVAFEVSPKDRVLQFASASFDASVSEIFVTLCHGGTLCLVGSDELLFGRNLMDVIQRASVTMAKMPPSVWLTFPNGAERELPALRTVISAGEACPASLVALWAPGRRFLNVYGPTEATVCATISECAPDGRPPAIGRPIPNVEVYVLDSNRAPVPDGIPGELYIGGAGLARGYLDDPALTAERFFPDPFSLDTEARIYRTGDRVRWRSDGELEFLGRLDRQVTIRGFRIEPGEIEAALVRHPQVMNAHVVGHKDRKGRERLVAYIASTDLEPPSGAAIHRFLAAEMPAYLIPTQFVLLPNLPLTSNGKIDAAALPPLSLEFAERTESDGWTKAEQLIATAWSEALAVKPMDRDETFFEQGGDSLSLISVQLQLEELFHHSVALEDLFRFPTIRSLACYLTGVEVASSTLTGQSRGALRASRTAQQVSFRATRLEHRSQTLKWVSRNLDAEDGRSNGNNQ